MSAFLPQSPLLLSVTKCRPLHAHSLICATSPPQPSSHAVQVIATALRAELPILFSPDPPPTQIYAPQVTFEDPLNKFRGLSRYNANIAFLTASPVFSKAALTVHNIAIHPSRPDTIRSRWTLSMAVNLPWRPVVSFTGQSDYVIDVSSGTVVRHVDYWDSLDDSTYFSFPAVKDLLAQCKPARVSPFDEPGFTLLRRTAELQIRSYAIEDAAGVVLRLQSTSDGLSEWRATEPVQNIQENGSICVVANVAVKALKNCPSSLQAFNAVVQTLQNQLTDVSYAQTANRAFHVSTVVRGKPVHEVWLEISNAKADVDF